MLHYSSKLKKKSQDKLKNIFGLALSPEITRIKKYVLFLGNKQILNQYNVRLATGSLTALYLFNYITFLNHQNKNSAYLLM